MLSQRDLWKIEFLRMVWILLSRCWSSNYVEKLMIYLDSGNRSSRAPAIGMERIIRSERLAMLDAVARGATAGSSRTARVANGSRPSGRVYGPH